MKIGSNVGVAVPLLRGVTRFLRAKRRHWTDERLVNCLGLSMHVAVANLFA